MKETNIFDNAAVNKIPLIQVLAMIAVDTRVHIRLRDYNAVCITTIHSARDVLSVCKKVYERLQHHPEVIGFGTKAANGVAILEVVCI